MSEHVWRKPRIVEIKVGSMADHALQYRGRGWAPLPLPPKGKAPTFAGWQSFVAEDSTEFNGNMGLLLGVLSGGLVDTDLDCKEAVALAPDMLPPTGAIFGRESNEHRRQTINGKTYECRAGGTIDVTEAEAAALARLGGWVRCGHGTLMRAPPPGAENHVAAFDGHVYTPGPGGTLLVEHPHEVQALLRKGWTRA